jgi:abortive infection bacteriophage resistance protein
MNTLQEYSKPYITPKNLVTDYLISKKGLSVQDDELEFAEQALSHINWYHLKIYFYPFIEDLTAEEERYKPQTTFRNGWDIYLLDDELRKIIITHTLKIELIVKSHIDQSITEFTKNPFWYLDDDYFIKNKQPYYERNKILGNMNSSDAEFTKHFKKNYKSPYKSYRLLPPFWIAMEVITFDQFLNIIEKVNPQLFEKRGENALDKCAKKLGAESFKQLKSWSEVIKNIRNKGCHNSRLWNANHMIPKGLEIYSPPIEGVSKPNKIYLVILAIYLMTKHSVAIDKNIKEEMIELFEKYESNILNLEIQMGFPENWTTEAIWR